RHREQRRDQPRKAVDRVAEHRTSRNPLKCCPNYPARPERSQERRGSSGMVSSRRMATVSLTVLPDSRTLQVESGTSILRAAHGAGVDITATCGGRGRCTSCRVKFVAGSVPPPTIGDEVQLGDEQVLEGYRLACPGTT